MSALSAEVIFFFIFGCFDGILINAQESMSNEDSIAEDCSKCGIEGFPATGTFLVVGGQPVEDTRSFPWMVRLESSSGECSAAIISDSYILTAGHCVKKDGKFVKKLKVHFQTESPKNMTVGVPVEKIIVHPKYEVIHYNGSKYDTVDMYDIALLKLKEKIQCDVYKNPICLPDASFKLSTGNKSLILGWGATKPHKLPSAILHYGSTKALHFEECIKRNPKFRLVKDHALCHGETNSTICYGDSGSPLVHKIGQKVYAVGVSSHVTVYMCPLDAPYVFVNVMHVVDWIKKRDK